MLLPEKLLLLSATSSSAAGNHDQLARLNAKVLLCFLLMPAGKWREVRLLQVDGQV
jgi:hypothetical protein